MTARQLQVAKLIAQGMKNQEIADSLFIDISTVKFHLTNIFFEFKVKNRVDLIFKLHRMGFKKCKSCGSFGEDKG